MKTFFVFALLLVSTLAAQAAPLQKWEYCVLHGYGPGYDFTFYPASGKPIKVKGKSGATLVQYLNRLGKNGWEAAGCGGNDGGMIWTLKKPFSPATKKTAKKR